MFTELEWFTYWDTVKRWVGEGQFPNVSPSFGSYVLQRNEWHHLSSLEVTSTSGFRMTKLSSPVLWIALRTSALASLIAGDFFSTLAMTQVCIPFDRQPETTFLRSTLLMLTPLWDGQHGHIVTVTVPCLESLDNLHRLWMLMPGAAIQTVGIADSKSLLRFNARMND